ncbi:probable 28S rRNA (cytosine-C(5))-methyltransferase [Copidosoma floridanum]|uniref:probable 28S rRNA (cytosine-C(5))-methyltransferase n=1 Tax=Copidosoma floridanum TaxID=29053 RepID=UPI0006C973E5|nr:probable 28S rRNA (cytosine-C(5))-methyltransferase [Copidosoma floridanum]
MNSIGQGTILPLSNLTPTPLIVNKPKIPPVLNGTEQDLDPKRRNYHDTYLKIDWNKPLPSEYAKIAKALKTVTYQKNVSLSSLIDPDKNMACQLMYNLCLRTKVHHQEIKFLLKKFNILRDNKKFIDEFTARVLIGEMLWGTQVLKSNSKEVQIMRYYEESFRDSFIEVRDIHKNPNDIDKFKLPIYVRINTLTISIDGCLSAFEKEGWKLLPRAKSYPEYLRMLSMIGKRQFIRDYHISELLAFPHGTEFYQHPGYLRGKFSYQDKGSCLSSFLLNPKPNSAVFDVCAAPGLKTNHLANIMGNTGVIYAVDNHPDRFEDMKTLLNLTDVKNVELLNTDYNAADIPREEVRYILVDPTSTYSGVFYSVGMLKIDQKYRLHRLSMSQSEILRYCLLKFPNVKRVIYTVCSLYPEEGEAIIENTLQAIGDSFSLLNVKEMLWNEWESMSPSDFPYAERCLRIIPEVDLCQGYFIAVFERNFDVPLPEYKSIIFDAAATSVVNMAENKKKIEPIPEPRVDDHTQRQLMILQNRMQKAQEQKLAALASKKQFVPDLLRWQNPAQNQPKPDLKRSTAQSNRKQGLLPNPGLLPSPGLLPNPTLSMTSGTSLLPNPDTLQNLNQLMTYQTQDLMVGRNLDVLQQIDGYRNAYSLPNEQQNSISQFRFDDCQNTYPERQNVFSQLQSSEPLFNLSTQLNHNQVEPPSLFSQPNQNAFSRDRANIYSDGLLNDRSGVFSQNQDMFPRSTEPPSLFSFQPSDEFTQSLFSQPQSSQFQQQSQPNRNSKSRSKANSERIIVKTHNQLWP